MSGAEENKPVPDWDHLPPGVVPTSLWSCLHDGYLSSSRSDLAGQSLVLEFDVHYLREHHGLPENCRFEFDFAGVQSVRASAYLRSTAAQLGHGVEPGRVESMSWAALEAALPDAPLDVYNAQLVQTDGGVALRIEGVLDGNDWCELVVRASRLSVHRSDGECFNLSELIGLGDAYWEAFARRSEERMRLAAEN